MKNSRFEFWWEVPDSGYAWEPPSREGRKREKYADDSLVELPSRSGIRRRYKPLETEPALFRTFADIAPWDKPAMAKFANRYGSLGLEGRRYRRFQPPPIDGEAFGFWHEEICSFRHVIRLWDLAADRKTTALAKFVRWESSRVIVTRDPEYPVLDSLHLSTAEIPQLSKVPGDLIKPAQCFVQDVVNRKMDEHGVVPRLIWDSGLKQLTFYYVPSTLIAAMWVQFAQAVSGNKVFDQCQHCGDSFEVTGQRRAGAKFCSDRCRARAYRARKALRLRLPESEDSLGH